MVGKGKTVKMVAARMSEARNEAVPTVSGRISIPAITQVHSRGDIFNL
jgi:hypothetical protein